MKLAVIFNNLVKAFRTEGLLLNKGEKMGYGFKRGPFDDALDAASKGDLETVKQYLAHPYVRATIDRPSHQLFLQTAADTGSYDLVKIILDAGITPKEEMAKKLQKKGIQIYP